MNSSPKATVNIAKIRAISGSNWFSRFETAMLTLEDMPARCAAFRQLSSSRRKVRRLLSGEGHHIYWVYFTIIGDVVKVLHIRHCSRKPPAKL